MIYYQILINGKLSKLYKSFVDCLLDAILYVEFEIVEVTKGLQPKLMAKKEN